MRGLLVNDNYPVTQLGFTLIVTFSVFFIVMLISVIFAIPLFNMNPHDLTSGDFFANTENINLIKYLQAIQSIGLFVIPPFILALFFSESRNVSYLKLDVPPTKMRLLWILIIMFAALPFINLVASLNAMVRLPDFMSGVQEYMDKASNTYQKASEALLKVTTLQDLAINILVIAIIPAIGEELFFRGILQRIFINMTRNVHWGIIIPAFIFSVVHFEFYGFFPRWILGVMFGYFLLWSGSLWATIFAHFVNNSMAVIAYYFISKNMLNEKAIDFGSGSGILHYTIICSFISGAGMYWLYRKRVTR
jgi:uncharacterized protein